MADASHRWRQPSTISQTCAPKDWFCHAIRRTSLSSRSVFEPHSLSLFLSPIIVFELSPTTQQLVTLPFPLVNPRS